MTDASAAAYLLVLRSVTDPDGAARYLDEAKRIGESYGGTYLARGAVPDVLEGDRQPGEGEAVVLIRFPDKATAMRFYNCEEYAPVKELAKQSFVRTLWLIEGIPGVI